MKIKSAAINTVGIKHITQGTGDNRFQLRSLPNQQRVWAFSYCRQVCRQQVVVKTQLPIKRKIQDLTSK